MTIQVIRFKASEPDATSDWMACKDIRTRVFIEEQQVPQALEWDQADHSAVHLLARSDDQPVGCARVLPDGHIGRMAVLPAWRGLGIGMTLLQTAIHQCQVWHCQQVMLSAQTHAVDFYRRAGFTVVSTPYLDAGILHVDMRKLL